MVNQKTRATGYKKRVGKPSNYSDDQLDALVQWLAEGMTNKQIHEASAKFDPPFEIDSRMISYYWRSKEVEIGKARAERQSRIIAQGVAMTENRIAKLVKLAEVLEADLFNHKLTWVERQKMLGSGQWGQIVSEKEFNAAEVRELRLVYDDLAKEVGDRVSRMDVTSKGHRILNITVGQEDDEDDEET